MLPWECVANVVRKVLMQSPWNGGQDDLLHLVCPVGRPLEWQECAPTGLQDFPTNRLDEEGAWRACARVLEMEIAPSAVALQAEGLPACRALRARLEVVGGGAPAPADPGAAADGGAGRKFTMENGPRPHMPRLSLQHPMPREARDTCHPTLHEIYLLEHSLSHRSTT